MFLIILLPTFFHFYVDNIIAPLLVFRCFRPLKLSTSSKPYSTFFIVGYFSIFIKLLHIINDRNRVLNVKALDIIIKNVVTDGINLREIDKNHNVKENIEKTMQ